MPTEDARGPSTGDALEPAEGPGRGGAVRPWSRLVPVVAPVAIAALVVAPWTRRGWLLLLDWIPGPHHSSLPRAFWGLDGTLQTAMPFALSVLGLSRVVGASTAGWLLVGVALAAAGVGAGRLVGGPPVRRLAAGALYAVNPLVFERTFAGQVGFLLAYAVLPLVAASVIRWRDEVSFRGMRPALWLALAVGLSPHLFWIGGVILVWHVAASRFRPTAAAWAALVVVVTVVLSSYAFVPSVGRTAAVEVGEADLVAFRTRGDPSLGLTANVAALYGFWRAGPTLPKDQVDAWPVFLAAIALLAAAGFHAALRDPVHRHGAVVIGLAGVTGLVLALGDQGAGGPVYRLLFDHLPGFAVMREPQKFAALLALAYAYGFGFGVERLVGDAGGRASRAVVAVALALPLLYTPTQLLGLGGSAPVSRFPASWTAADRLMGAGEGKVLFLPWHQYLAFPFTGHVIGNPAEPFFRRDVIAGDNVELPNLPTSSALPRSHYLGFLLDHGGDLCAFGSLVRSLGVEYVVLAKAADHQRYAWLAGQADLELVLDEPEIRVYRNLAYAGLAWRSPEPVRVADWGRLATLANEGRLGAGAHTVEVQRPGPIGGRPCAARADPRAGPEATGPAADRRSPVSYSVGAGRSGYVVLAEPFDRSWRLGGRSPVQLAEGTLAIATDGRPGTARFGHWSLVRGSYAVSVTVAAVILAGTLRSHVRRRAAGVEDGAGRRTEPPGAP